jgi:hypothetical protein
MLRSSGSSAGNCRVVARDGIEPSNKALQTLPVCFGFRALSHNADMVTKMIQGVTAPWFTPIQSGSTRRDPPRSTS